MVNDQEPRYRLVDADGNVVGSLFAESDGTLKLQEGTSGNDFEASFSPSGEFNARDVNTGTLLVSNTVTSRLVEEKQFDGANTISFNIPDLSERYFLEFSETVPTGSGRLELNANNINASGNGEYIYWDETGTKLTGEDSILLVDYNGFDGFEGVVRIQTAIAASYFGCDNSLAFRGSVTGFSQKGAWEGNEVFDSLQVTMTGGADGTVRLWEGI